MTPLQVAKPVVHDLLAAIGFAAVFFVAKKVFHAGDLESVYFATGAGILIGVIQFAGKKISGEPIGPLQWLSVGVVIALGAMTIAFHNDHFIKLKPTVIDLVAGIFMATRDWMTPYMPADVRENVPRRTIMLTEKLWAAVMIFFALLNIPVAFLFDSTVWVIYATFVPTSVIVALFFFQYSIFQSLARRNARARLAS